jgi:uncharacterized Zn-finger protein
MRRTGSCVTRVPKCLGLKLLYALRMAPSFTSTSTTLTGKRKRQTEPHAELILHIAASDSDADAPPVAQARKRPFACNYAGCTKSYSKPSRLAEHERTHTGEVGSLYILICCISYSAVQQRPYVCPTCQNSYLRESHLQAHARSHLPSSSRPLGCAYEGCDKRFWTPQHLRVHADTHTAEKLFKASPNIRFLAIRSDEMNSVPRRTATRRSRNRIS